MNRFEIANSLRAMADELSRPMPLLPDGDLSLVSAAEILLANIPKRKGESIKIELGYWPGPDMADVAIDWMVWDGKKPHTAKTLRQAVSLALDANLPVAKTDDLVDAAVACIDESTDRPF